MSEHHPRRGDRYVVTAEFQAIMLTHWFAPFTGGGSRPIPVGLEFIVTVDPPAKATAVNGQPHPSDVWEKMLVDERERTAEKYGGYSVSIPLTDLATHCPRR